MISRHDSGQLADFFRALTARIQCHGVVRYHLRWPDDYLVAGQFYTTPRIPVLLFFLAYLFAGGAVWIWVKYRHWVAGVTARKSAG
jgi:hypothetical protein